ncbi:AAA family ATPase [Pasteurella canis]|uniref:AAA family ATPase n=1 Tax=Pasteurella canis TaxID=753 RepID=UPI000D858E75|nr:AAA family ATPase [Pasteurella canis]SPY34257.1 Uncharacterized protein conserved in bacteria [Pasteurella canis]
MNNYIKKFDYIRNLAVFRNFSWDINLRDKGNNIINFSEINIIYGRNYSGKTTLSRVFRALETGKISDKYQNPEFSMKLDNNITITQNELDKNNCCIRVFNEDFVNENLRFFVDETSSISSFAVLGDDNKRIEEKIENIEKELGSREKNTGLLSELIGLERELEDVTKNSSDAKRSLEESLRSKATDRDRGIKYNNLFGDINYNISKLKSDIDVVKNDNFSLSNNDIEYLKLILKDEERNTIQKLSQPNLNYKNLYAQAKNLVERVITISEPIQDLLNDTLLAEWVRQGIGKHKDKRTTCAFCHSLLPHDLWERLDKHFNQESEELRGKIENLISQIEKEKNNINSIVMLEKNLFYAEFQKDIEDLSLLLKMEKEGYISSLDKIKEILKERQGNIYSSLFFSIDDFPIENVFNLINRYNKVVKSANDYASSISSKQADARRKLLLDDVYNFIHTIKYDEKIKEIEDLEKIKNQKEELKNSKKEEVEKKEQEILALKASLSDETKGADKVNSFLTHFLTGQSLSLKAIKNDSGMSFKFEIYRDGKKAYHLSEGERSLIAFCYFIAKLSDLSTKDQNPIVYIDDPICSLDSNHIFFVFSLICSELFYKKQENGNLVSAYKFIQLFISTHNLEFFKYLHRLPTNKNKLSYFLVERELNESKIIEMPKYLKKYATEFNYLFECIYKCSQISNPKNENYHILYNFANNARKFLEIYLYYQYPTISNNNEESKLEKFFGAGQIPSFLNRINNEYSHLDGGLERGAMPIDFSEAQICAKAILDTIAKRNPEQFQALKESIGCK